MQGDKIVKRILDDAMAKANEIESTARVQAQQILKEAQEFESQKLKETEKKIFDYANSVKDKYSTQLKIEGNKILLNVKQEILKDLQNYCVEMLSNLEKGKLLNLIEQILNENASSEEVILFNAKNLTIKDLEGLDIVKKLNLCVKEAKQIPFGMVLSSEVCDKDFTFETLVSEVFENNENEINKMLF